MTPLHISILMHYFTCADDYEMISNPTRSEYAYQLAKKGYLYTPISGNVFKITAHGKAVVMMLLELIEKAS